MEQTILELPQYELEQDSEGNSLEQDSEEHSLVFSGLPSLVKEAVVMAWFRRSTDLKVYVRKHLRAFQVGDLRGAYLMEIRLGQALRLRNEEMWESILLDALKGKCKDGETEQAWAAFYIAKECFVAGRAAAAVTWLTKCGEFSRENYHLRFECLLIRDSIHCWSNVRDLEVADEMLEVSLRLNNVEYYALALGRKADALGKMGYRTEQREVSSLLQQLSSKVADHFHLFHFGSFISSVVVGDIYNSEGESRKAYSVYLEALKHLLCVPDLQQQLHLYLGKQKQVGEVEVESLWPLKCHIAANSAVALKEKLQNLGIEASEEDRRLLQKSTEFHARVPNTRNEHAVSHLRTIINECLSKSLEEPQEAETILEELEANAAELLSRSYPAGMDAVFALQVLAHVGSQYHKDNIEQREDMFQVLDSLLSRAENLASQQNVEQHWQVIYQRSNLLQMYWRDNPTEILQSLVKPFSHFLEMESRMGSVSKLRILLLDRVSTMFESIQMWYLEAGRVDMSMLWAERGRARDLVHQISELGIQGSDHVSTLAAFDFSEKAAYMEMVSILEDAGQGTVFVLLSRVGSTGIYNYALHMEEPVTCVTVDECMQKILQVIANSGQLTSQHLKMMYSFFIQPHEKLLKKVRAKRLVIIPTKELSLLPFSAFMYPGLSFDLVGDQSYSVRFDSGSDSEQEKYLIQMYEVIICPSMRMFKFCEQRNKAMIVDQTISISNKVGLVVGNPTGDLEGAQEEAVSIKEMLHKAGILEIKHLERKQATKSAVTTNLLSCYWAHISTHAEVNEKYPRGAMLLSPDENDNGTGRGENGPLLVEVDGYDRQGSLLHCKRLSGDNIKGMLNTKAVVLSACTSGIGELRGEGMLGLPRAFHIAGVPACIASLWNVPDAETQTLMLKFYQGLCEGQGVSKAMQEAMKFMIECQDDLGLPLYSVQDWAAFFVSGSPVVTI